ncbi:MAG: N-acyl-D-glutamate deacylase [candidate division WS2 bacterium]|nr:N-acyl-D-glutamate deacylase [Candidatus Psychracetigena formicireducens]
MDILIKNGRVVDPRSGIDKTMNLYLNQDKIAYIGEEKLPAGVVLDASGYSVVPGFIDIHAHGEKVEDSSTAECLLRQGVTTILSGNCGNGYTGYKTEVIEREKQGLFQNWLGLVGHSFLRNLVGVSDRYIEASSREVEEMKEILKINLKEGAKGVSFGLEYNPGASTGEVLNIISILADFPGSLATFHVRYDAQKVEEAIKEVITISRLSKVPVQLSHLGSMAGFGRMSNSLNLIENAVAEGLDIMIDCYPYNAFATSIGTAVFDEGFEERWGMGLEALEIASGSYKGISLTSELFKMIRKTEPDTIVIAHVLQEEEVFMCLKHPLVMLGSDGGFSLGEGHPRGAGAFPRFLRLVREKKLMPEKESLLKISWMPAKRLGIHTERGRIAEGHQADLVILDLDRVREKATFQSPTLPPEGIRWVLVNGKIAVDNGTLTGATAGKVLLNK